MKKGTLKGMNTDKKRGKVSTMETTIREIKENFPDGR